MTHRKTLFLTLTILQAGAGICQAGISLPNIFGDHMVVQAEKPIAVWGRGNPGESVTVEIVGEDGKVVSTAAPVTVQADKRWSVELPSVAAGLTVSMRVTGSESGEKIQNDVLTGEVWLLSGQSNMRWSLQKSKDGAKEVAAANHPTLRLFLTDVNSKPTPQGDLPGKWEVCTPETAANFSGPGYFFGRDLMQALDRPVGLICSAVGGTPIRCWTPRAAMDGNPATAHIGKDYQDYVAGASDKANAPRRKTYGEKNEYAPSFLFNGMIAPLMPLTIRGVAWCQGERNSQAIEGLFLDGPDVYAVNFPLMITSWREKWGQGDFPFLYVEMANFMKPVRDPVEEDGVNVRNWAYIREAQAAAIRLPDVYGISAIDLGEADEIHYANKQEVGRRLALAALGGVYEKAKTPFLSPRYESHAMEGNKVRIRFADADGLTTRDGLPPATFAIKGEKGEWVLAEASIDGRDILVRHPDTSKPVAVRHAWASNPAPNVINGAGLPLSTFRTDRPSE